VGFRLIPREERFFDDFQALADQIRVGAQLLEELAGRDDGDADGDAGGKPSARRSGIVVGPALTA